MEKGYQPIGNGLRFNEGKNRLDLLPVKAMDELSKILTVGAQKYAERNWERGMSWSSVLASLKRHLKAYEDGEDYDRETSCLHIAHVLCNASFLTEYYHIFPEGDDRVNSFRYKKLRKIGLDIDDVLADFVGAYCKRFGLDRPNSWSFDRKFHERMAKIKKDKSFWLDLEPLISPKELPFEPICYITNRSVNRDWTEEWLDKFGFPVVNLYVTEKGQPKSEIAKKVGIDTFVDDNFNNFVHLNSEGINCYLMDATHNKRYDVGYKRIESLHEVPMFMSK